MGLRRGGQGVGEQRKQVNKLEIEMAAGCGKLKEDFK